jgi:hypothetical protein
MSETRTASFLQTTSHVLVVGAGVVYLFGFIVVSIFDASYGIADFNLFRTKVIAVGSLFVFLLAVPMVATFRMFSFFGLTVEHVNPSPIEVSPKNRIFMIADMALSIPFACIGLTVLLVFLSPKFSLGEWKGWGFGLFILLVALGAAQAISARKWFNAHPFLFVFVSSLNTAALFFVVFRYTDRSYFWLVLWLSLVCLFTLQTSLKLRTPEALRKTEWERLLLIIVPAIFGLYATKVYPNIKHQFGGGAPVPIVLHLTKKLPVFESDNPSVSLIDETEQGFYVLRGSDKAVFVARGLVEEVEFLRDVPVTDTNAKKP